MIDDKKNKETKIGIVDMLKAQATMARLGFKITKDQANAASEGIILFQHIISLSQKANTYIYNDQDRVKADANFKEALGLIQQAKDEVLAMHHNAGPIGVMFPKMQEQLDKSLKQRYKKLCYQQAIIEDLSSSNPVQDEKLIDKIAEDKVQSEWI